MVVQGRLLAGKKGERPWHMRAIDRGYRAGRHPTAPPWHAANAVRLQLHALSYNLGNFLRTLATSSAIWKTT
jgi:hypothetical protein